MGPQEWLTQRQSPERRWDARGLTMAASILIMLPQSGGVSAAS